MATKERWAGIALAEDIGATIKDSLRAYPEGVEVGDIIYALFRNIAEYANKNEIEVSQVGAAWNEFNRGTHL